MLYLILLVTFSRKVSKKYSKKKKTMVGSKLSSCAIIKIYFNKLMLKKMIKLRMSQEIYIISSQINQEGTKSHESPMRIHLLSKCVIPLQFDTYWINDSIIGQHYNFWLNKFKLWHQLCSHFFPTMPSYHTWHSWYIKNLFSSCSN